MNAGKDTEEDENKEGCLETRVKVLIYPSGAVPVDEVTRLLGVEPNRMGRQGELWRYNRDGEPRIHTLVEASPFLFTR